jgi:hypothetical protein
VEVQQTHKVDLTISPARVKRRLIPANRYSAIWISATWYTALSKAPKLSIVQVQMCKRQLKELTQTNDAVSGMLSVTTGLHSSGHLRWVDTAHARHFV